MSLTKTNVLVPLIAICFAVNAHAGDDNRDRDRSFQRTFEVKCTGEQEVTTPAGGVETETRCKAYLRFDKGLTKVDYQLDVREGTAVTQAHIHCALAGTNGPIVVFLFPLTSPGVDVDGELAEGTLTQADLLAVDFAANPACGLTINNISSLLHALREGRLYVNVHSEDNPAGEVRGQIFGE